MIHIFIDTNMYLNFYRFSGDDIIELQGVIELINSKKAKLYITEQNHNEFFRNREKVINDAIKIFDKEEFASVPSIIKQDSEYDSLKRTKEEYTEVKKKILTRVKELIRNQELNADKLINNIFNISSIIKTSDDIILKSRNRFDLGNPPGKSGSYGDAINRETLLENVPEGEPLHFIGEDGDFCSIFDNNQFNSFLQKEWENNKKSSIIYYRTISSFFRKEFPSIKVTTDLKRGILIKDLIESNNFNNSRKYLKMIQDILPLTNYEFSTVIDGLLNNGQIYMMVDYSKGYLDYIYKIIEPHFIDLTNDLKKKFIRLYGDKDGELTY